jgi:hypothetical protein
MTVLTQVSCSGKSVVPALMGIGSVRQVVNIYQDHSFICSFDNPWRFGRCGRRPWPSGKHWKPGGEISVTFDTLNGANLHRTNEIPSWQKQNSIEVQLHPSAIVTARPGRPQAAVAAAAAAAWE